MSKSSSVFLFLISAFVLFPVVSCDLVSNEESSATVTPTESAPGTTVLPGQLSGDGDWAISLDGAVWHGCTIDVDIHIMYSGDTVAVFGKDNTYDDARSLYIQDKYDQKFYSTYYEAGDRWEDWYQLKYYPDESRSGTLQFNIDSRSETIWLYMEGRYIGSRPVELFYLYDVPSPCD